MRRCVVAISEHHVSKGTAKLNTTAPEKRSFIDMAVTAQGLVINELLKQLDVDGDGDIDEEDKKIGEQLKEMDTNGDGFVTLKELVSIGKAQIEEEKNKGRIKKLMVLIAILVVLVCGAMLSMGVAAVEAAKDSKPDESGELKTTTGTPIQMATATRTYNGTDFVDLPASAIGKTNEMIAIQAGENGARNFYQCAGWDKKSNGDITLFTPSPETVIIYKAEKRSVVKKCPTCPELPLASLTLTVEQGTVTYQ